MVDADGRGWHCSTRIPTGVEQVPIGIRRRGQLDQREVDVGPRRAQRRAVLVVGTVKAADLFPGRDDEEPDEPVEAPGVAGGEDPGAEPGGRPSPTPKP